MAKFALLYYNPFWRRGRRYGPWAVRAWYDDGLMGESYFVKFRHAVFQLLVCLGIRQYSDP